ncbi:MAG: phosphonate ABC transporter ATP-binding protein [Gammaproteobacteria bacterium HGW-Gammaproteobacteria-6]|nr:MAG: phosphonate ABC transporter ATP-binding protein [Gammaproteobacteria bacterium HGW-Gammaproteobacteria-6]
MQAISRAQQTDEASTKNARQIQLKTQQASVTYGNGHKALMPNSLNFYQGEFVVLLGASGAGKSTLLRSLNGLVKPTEGSVISTTNGDIGKTTNLRNHRRQTGMIFQQHHLIGRLSVLNNVLLGRIGYHSCWRTLLPWSTAEKHMALAALERVGLLDHALQRADQLSGGQQQRVGVARALIQQPDILLADEPVASLDPATAEQLLTLIHSICKSDGLTAIVSLHQVDFARHFADRIVGLRAGSVVFDGLPSDLTDDVAKGLYQKSEPQEALDSFAVPDASAGVSRVSLSSIPS